MISLNMVVFGWSFFHSSIALFAVCAVIFIFFQQVSMYLRVFSPESTAVWKST